MKKEILILIGSQSDMPIMENATALLDEMGVGYRVEIASAHRTPERVRELVTSARGDGIKVIIAAAGHAAHLAGVAASYTTLPVIGVPLDSSPLKGIDSLLATVQMPGGVPVAAMAIGKSGALNAALFAAEILAINDERLSKVVDQYRESQKAKVLNQSGELNRK